MDVCTKMKYLYVITCTVYVTIAITLLKLVPSSIAESLAYLFNKSVTLCAVPQEWKLANITPIPKSNINRNKVENYRPISLLSVPSKIQEKFISFIMSDHIENNNLLSNCQWGFRPGRSTTTALLDVNHFWFSNLDRGKELIVVFFDYSKAFDSVPHLSLLECLRDLGFSVHLLAWFQDYLTNRSQQVVINGRSSSPIEVISGVPQGSILGPLFFILYINGVTNLPLSPNTKLMLYADDMSLSKVILDVADVPVLQSDIDRIYTWSQQRHLTFNKSKSKFMIITKKRLHLLSSMSPILYLGNTQLERVSQYRYLGVLLSEDLKWNLHINAVCNKTRRIIGLIIDTIPLWYSIYGLIYRQLYLYSSPDFLLQLYKTIIRPHLEYASVIGLFHLISVPPLIDDKNLENTP